MSSKTSDKKKKNAEKGSKRGEFKKGQVLKMMLIRKAFNVIIRSHLKVWERKFVLDVSEKGVRKRYFYHVTHLPQMKLSTFLKFPFCLYLPIPLKRPFTSSIISLLSNINVSSAKPYYGSCNNIKKVQEFLSLSHSNPCKRMNKKM